MLGSDYALMQFHIPEEKNP